MIVVSIIIPIYKVEQYIITCIESVLVQSYRNLEVILVDDCSPDRSMDIAREYIRKSTKSQDVIFKYTRHDCNRGLSAARNTGIQQATGDYLYFLDSDDEITANCIELLVHNSNNGQTDVVCGGFKVVGNEKSLWNKNEFADICLSGNRNIVNYYVSGRLYVMACNKMIRRDLLIKNNLIFKEGVIHEDNHWSFIIMNNIETLRTLRDRCYLYNYRSTSITGTPNYRRRYDSYVQILEEFNKAEKNGTIKAYPESLHYIDKQKLLWMRELSKIKEITRQEKFRYFTRVLKLNRSFSFLMHYSTLPIQELFWQIIDFAVLQRSKLYKVMSKK